MSLNANSLTTNLLVTALVGIMVFLLPWADRRICRRLGLNLEGGISKNPNADRLLKVRQILLITGFVCYLALFFWLAFLSRSDSGDYAVHVAPLEDLKNAFSTPHGFSDVFRTLFTDGFAAAFSEVRIVRPEDIAQFYMNVMFFVPMGYLLPYIFHWFRARVKIRPVLFCFLLSLLVENLQLITRRGFYDMDDLISNTLGGWIGQMLFIAVGFVVTHPDWREDLRRARRIRRNQGRQARHPLGRRISPTRVTLMGTNENAVWDFYVGLLGFHPRRQLIPQNYYGKNFLFELDSCQLEVRCTNQPTVLAPQYLTLYATRFSAVRKRLEKSGIQGILYDQDPYTGFRQLRFCGPDNVLITIIEAD